MFSYFPLAKALQKHTKTIKDVTKKITKTTEVKVEKQILETDQKPITGFLLRAEAIYQLIKIKEIEQKFNRDDLTYKIGNMEKAKTYDF